MTPEEADTASREHNWKELVIALRERLVVEEFCGHLQNANIEELFDSEFYATAKDSLLSVWLHFETGDGSWRAMSKRLDECEPWFMAPSGEAILDGETLDLQALTDRFVSMLTTSEQ